MWFILCGRMCHGECAFDGPSGPFQESDGRGLRAAAAGKMLLLSPATAADSCIEKVLIPELDPGSVVILDNLATHNSDTATRMLKAHGCHFLFLPACSPDLNPIEMAFPKLKAHLRRIGARTFDQLIEAIGEICDLFTPDQCRNFFHAAGYTS